MRRCLACLALLSSSALPSRALATDYYASPSGNGDGQSEGSPTSVSSAINSAQPGETVYLLSGTYSGWNASLHPVRSGTADAWITFAAAPGALPIFDTGGLGSGTYEYIRYIGIASRNGSSGGFGNGWTDGNCSQMSNGNLQYINCIADNNGINGIAHYCASGLLIRQSIVAHNGNQDPSWSSGVNLFAVQGDASSNIVEQTISFENLDISLNHSDGSGFILDQNSTGATFRNNIGFHNGGSCIRLTNSTNAQLINNTCVNNGLDPLAKYHDEIFFSDTSTTHQGATLRNNLCIPTSGQSGLTMGNGVPSSGDIFDGTAAYVVGASGPLDFHLANGSPASDAGTAGEPTPADDIGFDWRCIKEQSGQAVSWWQYAIDYDYIASIGGIAECFKPGARDASPDVGAYEFGAASGGTGGAPAEGGTGGTPAAGGTVPSAGGSPVAGGAPSGGGGSGVGGAAPTTGGAPGLGGNTAAGGTGTACSAPLTPCGTACVDLTTDPMNCGACGVACAADQSCASGTCAAQSACQAPLVQCGDACVNTTADPLHCGSCDAPCEGDRVCSSGACTTQCGGGLTQCGAACVDLASDALNCGACNVSCLVGQTCAQRACAGTPTGGDPTVPVPPTAAAPTAAPTTSDDSGCGCAVVRTTPGGAAWLALGAALLLRARRRQAR